MKLIKYSNYGDVVNTLPMRIYNPKKFLFRLFISLYWVAVVLLPILVGIEFQRQYHYLYFIAGFFLTLMAELLVYGLWKLGALFVTWASEKKVINRWLYWITAADDAEKFVEKL